MRAATALLLSILVLCAGCTAPAPPPAAATSPDPRDPQERAKAVEAATLEAKRRQDEALERQGG